MLILKSMSYLSIIKFRAKAFSLCDAIIYGKVTEISVNQSELISKYGKEKAFRFANQIAMQSDKYSE